MEHGKKKVSRTLPHLPLASQTDSPTQTRVGCSNKQSKADCTTEPQCLKFSGQSSTNGLIIFSLINLK